jgi:hypothetical protein
MLKHTAIILASLVAAGPVWAQTNYDPFDTELPSAISTDWTLGLGDEFIEHVSGGFTTIQMGGGDGLWIHNDAGLNSATGWTMDVRFRTGLANTVGQRSIGLLMREPGGGQLELRVQSGEFALAGEGAGVLGGGSQPFTFNDGNFHTIRISRLGSNVQVFVDDIAAPYLNATFTQSQDFGGNRVYFGRVGSDNAGLAIIDSIDWDTTQADFTAPGNNPGNNIPRVLTPQPEFQLGWYVSAYFSDPTYTTDMLDEMQAHGFNTVRHADMGDGLLGRLTSQDPGSTQAAAINFMDQAALRGIGVEVNLRKNLTTDTVNEHENLRQMVALINGHAALASWQIGEEPSDPGGPSEVAIANFRAMSSTMKALDTDAPVSAVFGGENTAFYGDYVTQVDIASADYYPVRNTVGWDTPSKMRQAVGRAQDLVGALGPGATPVWVNQAFDTAGYDLPTADQQRYLTWAPVTVGVKGAMFFSYHHMSPAERDALIYSVTDELVTLIPAITSDTPAPTVTSDADSSTPGDGINDVTYLTRKLDDAVYIFAAGNQLVGQTVEFTIAHTFDVGTMIEVVGESRTITPSLIGPGSLVFSDSFDPLSIHIYKILQALAGDLNSDGFVGIEDLNIVLGNWNDTVTPGDLLMGDPSGDGFVGIEDLNQVLGNWNAGTPPTQGGAIPEPGSLALLAMGTSVLVRNRLRRA